MPKNVTTFSLRLTEQETRAIDAKASALGLSRAGLVRRLFERAGVLGTATAQAGPAPTVEPQFKR